MKSLFPNATGVGSPFMEAPIPTCLKSVAELLKKLYTSVTANPGTVVMSGPRCTKLAALAPKEKNNEYTKPVEATLIKESTVCEVETNPEKSQVQLAPVNVRSTGVRMDAVLTRNVSLALGRSASEIVICAPDIK